MIPNSPEKLKRELTPEARAAMSAGAKKARQAAWGKARKPSRTVRVDADVAELLMELVSEPDRRRFVSDAISSKLKHKRRG